MKKNTNVNEEEDYDFDRDSLSDDIVVIGNINNNELEGINDFIEEFEYLNED